MAIQPDTEILVHVEKPVAGGRMLARHEGQVVLVAGAIPGERVRARIARVTRHMAFADTVEVVDPSRDRRSSHVDWACGGSLYAHIEYRRQLALKAEVVADSFSRIGKIALPAPVEVMPSTEEGYRMRARLHARDGTFGFFREGTHDLCAADQTRQLLPATIAVLDAIADALSAAGLTVSSCELSENVEASERAVLLEMPASGVAPLHMEPIAGLTGLLFADPQTSRVSVSQGSPFVTDHIAVGGAAAVLTHHVQSFFQGNRYLLEPMITRVLAQVTGDSVTDLYAGVGLFAIALASRGLRRLVAVEGDRSSARDLDANAAPFGGAIRVEHLSVEDFLSRRGTMTPDTLVLDPPRTGISARAMAGILKLKPVRVVYVSCDVATVARDVKRFLEDGYSLQHIESFDLFPNTAHVETLVVLST